MRLDNYVIELTRKADTPRSPFLNASSSGRGKERGSSSSKSSKDIL